MLVADTHVIIWEALEPGKLSKKARLSFNKANESSGIIFCDISLGNINAHGQKANRNRGFIS